MSHSPGAKRCQEIYDMLLEEKGDDNKVNFLIFRKFGTCTESGYILGHHDRDFGSGLETFIKLHLGFIMAFLKKHFLLICLSFFLMVGKTSFYVIDIVKDVKFVSLFNSKRTEKSDSNFSGLLDVGLAAAIGFLVCSEVFKMWQLYESSRGASRAQRFLCVALSPFQLIPLLIHHYERKLELQLHQLCAITELNLDQMEALTQTQKDLTLIRKLKG